MSTCRKVLDPSELAEIHADDEGYVLHPFGRIMHAAGCPTVGSMSLNPKEPKWFCLDAAAARDYQRSRLAIYASAQPFKRARCCEALIDPDVVVERGGSSMSASPAAADPKPKLEDVTSSPPRPDWLVRHPSLEDRSVELWTVRRTPFETDQSSAQKAMVRDIEPILQQLECGPDERLHGIFTSDEIASNQPDAENIALYNFGARPFAGAGYAIGFERSYAPAPPPPGPLSTRARNHHSWRVVPDEAPFAHWTEGDVVVEWRDVPIDLHGDLGLSAWRAIRENPDDIVVNGRLSAADYYAVMVSLSAPAGRLPSVVKAVKNLVDGPLAGLQRADHLPHDVTAKLLRRHWARPIDEAMLHDLVSAERPPAVLPRPPFNRNGLDPCDELCVAGIARLVESGGDPSFSGTVVRAAKR
jgi:hypothetical protein